MQVVSETYCLLLTLVTKEKFLMIFGDITHVKHLSEAHVYVAIKQPLWARYACISSETGISPENERR